MALNTVKDLYGITHGGVQVKKAVIVDVNKRQDSFGVGIVNGHSFSEIRRYSQTIAPASVAANLVAEQTFTVTGLAVGDVVVVNPGAILNATGIVGARVSAANTLAVLFVNPTAGALTPTSTTWLIFAYR